MSANASLAQTPPPVTSALLESSGPARGPEALLTSYVVIFSLAAIVIHFIFGGRYGYFRDELYYAACGQHLSWGYVDHAPLIALVSRLSRALLGDSLHALRFFPALAAGMEVFLAGWMAREMGGRRFAQALAALTVLLAPVFLTFDNFLSMNAFEPVFWMLCAAIMLRILNGASERLWILFGIVAGIGMLNKHSMVFFGSGICVGVLLTPARQMFRRPCIWCGAAIALAICLPNILWEANRGWPTIQLLRTVAVIKNSHVSAWDFLWQQTLLTNPVAAPIWLAGVWYLLRDSAGRKYSVLGVAYLTVLAELLVLHGKIYYLAPAYPMLLAAGSVWIEKAIVPRTGTWLKPALIAPLVTSGILAAPLAMPILPVKAAVAYTRFWDVKKVRVEEQQLGELPQLFADMFGWEDQVAAIARVFSALPSEKQSKCALLAYNYGEAGAIDYFGPRYGLPKAISGHNQYALWGPRGYSGETVIAIGFPEKELRKYFDEVAPAATVVSEYAMPEEAHLTIFLCGKPRAPLDQLWPRFKYLA